MALTANGNLQRILSSYHNARVTVKVVRSERLRAGLYEREVVLTLENRRPCALASSVVTAFTLEAQRLIDDGTGLGQIFTTLGELPQFRLLEVGRGARTFRRVYTLSSPNVMCHIEETMPANLFDTDFPDAAREDPFDDLAADFVRRCSLPANDRGSLFCHVPDDGPRRGEEGGGGPGGEAG